MIYGKAITRDGFTASFGRFRTTRGNNERVEPLSLRSMFLPKLSRKGQKMLRDRSDFVLSQRQHYGVPFKESQISGTGEGLMRKRYFLRSGEHDPNHTKTTTVIRVPFPQYDYGEDRAGRMQEAADNVAGLHHTTGVGPETETQTILLGWDAAAVRKAAKVYANEDPNDITTREQERENERAEMHADYLDDLKRMKGAVARKAKSPVGSYVVDCVEIENRWSALAEDMRLEIQDTEQKGTFHATFDFGVVKGVMIISEGDMTESEEEGDCGVEDDDDYERPAIGTKRKPIAPKRGRPSKKAKAGKTQSYTYQFKFRCRECGEGEIFSRPEHGTMKCNDGNFATLTAKAGFPCVGPSVTFTARKVSHDPELSDEEWDDYSEGAYEHARTRRWR
ncbi:hypothetical protein AbraIFM66950_006839 [Aspergillus brasiliensis]|nr:hypothetical protein AbraIFM66950_006839 [Aspergillus brasiliensis]